MKKNIVLISALLLLGALTIVTVAQSQRGLDCSGYTAVLTPQNVIPNQVIGLCNASRTPVADYVINEKEIGQRSLNFTPIAVYGDCEAGLGFREITYATFNEETVCPLIVIETQLAYTEMLGEQKTRSRNNLLRGGLR